MQRKFIFRFLYFLLLLLFFFAAGEITLRIIGFNYSELKAHNFKVSPEGPFFVSHPDYGYCMKPGSFSIVQDRQLKWHST